MKTTPHWRPAPKDAPPPGELPEALGKAIERRLWDDYGHLREEVFEVGFEIIPYLEGLEDGNVDGAAELLAAIREHDRVWLWIGG
jgi:hypothetical protein